MPCLNSSLPSPRTPTLNPSFLPTGSQHHFAGPWRTPSKVHCPGNGLLPRHQPSICMFPPALVCVYASPLSALPALRVRTSYFSGPFGGLPCSGMPRSSPHRVKPAAKPRLPPRPQPGTFNLSRFLVAPGPILGWTLLLGFPWLTETTPFSLLSTSFPSRCTGGHGLVRTPLHPNHHRVGFRARGPAAWVSKGGPNSSPYFGKPSAACTVPHTASHQASILRPMVRQSRPTNSSCVSCSPSTPRSHTQEAIARTNADND